MNILISGAGPIGLITSCILKKKYPDAKIIVYEKYAKYQRKHNLILDVEQFDELITAADLREETKVLRDRLQVSSKIATADLQQELERQAVRLGVDIHIVEGGKGLTKDNFTALVLAKNPSLIIGADGVRGYIHKHFFCENNQQTYNTGYQLQLRYRIKSTRSIELPLTELLRIGSKYGTVTVNHTGTPNTSKEAKATLSIMLSKQQFKNLSDLKSAYALSLFKSPDEISKRDPSVASILQACIVAKSQLLTQHHAYIMPESIQLSVSRAPVITSKEILHINETTSIPVLLVGDASLGLSYFKGLSAGIRSLTHLSKVLPKTSDDSSIIRSLRTYQTWFKKHTKNRVNNMLFYYYTRIGIPTYIFKSIRNVMLFFAPGITMHPYHYTHSVYTLLKKKPNTAYIHRKLKPVICFDENIPFAYSLQRIQKIFTDLIKPIKSIPQFIQIILAPLVALYLIYIAICKLITKYTLQSLFSALGLLFRGLVMLFTYPISVASLPIRFIHTLVRKISHHTNPNFLQNNTGLARLVKMFANASDNQVKISICFDLYRKTLKASHNGQKSYTSLNQIKLAYSNFEKDYLENNPNLEHSMRDLIYQIKHPQS
jgi:hypothetical protein